MRGARPCFLLALWSAGIIPAYAGSTWSAVEKYTPGWDHPRVCGEHQGIVQSPHAFQGSSPRMRGALEVDTKLLVGVGIIPAYAGSTRLRVFARIRCDHHPRVCGEHSNAMALPSIPLGSSPRMRGARTQTHASGMRTGIIPAYAGSTGYA